MSDWRSSATDETTVLGRYGDLALVTLLALLAGHQILGTTGWGAGPGRILLGFLVVFALPGYALTALLFPTVSVHREGRRGTQLDASALRPVEWVVLTVGLSIAVVPTVGFVLNFTTWGITRTSVAAGVVAVVVTASLLAAVRRFRAPSDHQPYTPLVVWVREGLSGLGGSIRHGPTAPTVTLVLLVVAAGLVGGTLATQDTGQDFTEFSLLADDTDDGRYVASDYPRSFQVGESRTLYTQIGNQEGEEMDYTVVVLIQSVSDEEPREVVTRSEISQFSTTVPSNGTATVRVPVNIREAHEGEQQLAFLLYRGQPPAEPTIENAYRSTHLWVTVGEEEA